MIPALAASLLFCAQGSPSVLPTPTPITVPDAVRDWPGFKYLPLAGRVIPNAFPAVGDWSGIKPDAQPDATVWRMKVVILDRVDRVHERGPAIAWTGHHGINPFDVGRVRRAVAQFQALAAHLSNGRCRVVADIVEEPQAITISGGDLGEAVGAYLRPRLNDGRYDAEDGVFRGPYPSVIVVHPVGGEGAPTFSVQGAVVDLVGIPSVFGQEIEGRLGWWLAYVWQGQVAQRARDAGLTLPRRGGLDPGAIAAKIGWPAILAGADDSTEQRLAALSSETVEKQTTLDLDAWAPRGKDTVVTLAKDPVRGAVLSIEELGNFRSGGLALPMTPGKGIDPALTPTFAFWAKSDAKDPIVLRFDPNPDGVLVNGELPKSIRLGTDVPFAYDDAWHRVKIDLRGQLRVGRILIAADARPYSPVETIRQTLGPISATFSDFEVTSEAPDAPPSPETPGPVAASPEARAIWAATAPPGEERRSLLKDPYEPVRANATAAALASPDPLDEPLLIDNALYNNEATVFAPALRALAKIGTPTALAAIRQALRSAASERARGLAAEVLADSGNPQIVPLVIGLNQARTRAARLSAVRALARIPGNEAALMRMAYLSQDDPEVKLAVTLASDPGDDAQGRKLLWSAINEPSDAVRLESLRLLSSSKIAEFREEGFKAIRDDSVGVRVRILEAWTAVPVVGSQEAIRSALSDPSPRVRAAAVAALAANVQKLAAKDLPFDDADPRVQRAVLVAAAAQGLAVPPEVRERLRKSPDPEVRERAGRTFPPSPGR